MLRPALDNALEGLDSLIVLAVIMFAPRLADKGIDFTRAGFLFWTICHEILQLMRKVLLSGSLILCCALYISAQAVARNQPEFRAA